MPDAVQPATATESLSESNLEGLLETQFTDPPNKPEKAAPEAPEASDADPSDELTAADIDAEDDEPKEPGTDESFEIVHNGQAHKLSRTELIEYGRKGFDYTQKTMDVAETKRQYTDRLQALSQVEQVQPLLAQELAQVSALQGQLQSQRYSDQEMLRLSRDDFVEHATRSEERNFLQRQLHQAAGQYQQKAQAVQQYVGQLSQFQLQQEAARLPELIPAWRNPEKASADKTEIAKYLQSSGVDMSQVGRYLDNAVAMKMVLQSMKYERLQQAKADKSKQLRTAPPVIRPGANVPSDKSRTQFQRAQGAFRTAGKQGRTGDQEKLLEAMFNRTYK